MNQALNFCHIMRTYSIWICILSLCFSHQLRADCCCCEDECGGMWWSRNTGKMALIAGGTIALGVVVGVMAGNASHRGHSSRSSTSPTTNTNAGNNANPILFVPNADVVPNLQVPTLTNTDALTGIDGLNTAMINNVTGTETTTTNNMQGLQKNAPSLNFQVMLVFDYESLLVKQITPFVIDPNGVSIEGTSVVTSDLDLRLESLIIDNPVDGLYQVGIKCVGTTGLAVFSTTLTDGSQVLDEQTTIIQCDSPALQTFSYST